MSKAYTVDMHKWSRLSFFEQMGNIGSEVGRALAAKHRNDLPSMEGALYRGLDLIDATVSLLVRKNSPAVKEVLRAREQFVEAVTTPKEDPGLESYFMQYAMAARLGR